MQRDLSLDVMRSLGILLVILAHAEPPAWLFQLRNFDVPLLIIVSAASIAYQYRSRPMHTATFLKRRVSKLVIPAWTFLTGFFLFVFTYTTLLGKPYPFSDQKILESYLFYHGIGYVWIFQVFLYIALLTPFLWAYKQNVTDDRVYFSFPLILYVLYEALNFFMERQLTPENYDIMKRAVLVIIPYGLLYMYGLKLPSLSTFTVLKITCFMGSVFATLAYLQYDQTGTWMQTQTEKYPPQLYYLSYAIFSTNLLYLFVKRDYLMTRTIRAMSWLSSNSLWVYLWHIFTLYAWNSRLGAAHGLDETLLKFSVVLSFSVMMTLFQNAALAWLLPQLAHLRARIMPRAATA